MTDGSAYFMEDPNPFWSVLLLYDIYPYPKHSDAVADAREHNNTVDLLKVAGGAVPLWKAWAEFDVNRLRSIEDLPYRLLAKFWRNAEVLAGILAGTECLLAWEIGDRRRFMLNACFINQRLRIAEIHTKHRGYKIPIVCKDKNAVRWYSLVILKVLTADNPH